MYAARYSGLFTSGGGGGRNCDPLFMVNGVTNPQSGVSAFWAGWRGSGFQSSGPMPGTYTFDTPAPSVARTARILAATVAPTATPAAAPLVTCARSAASAALSCADCFGNRATSVSWAAWATAASIDAPGASSTSMTYGVNDSSIELTASNTAADTMPMARAPRVGPPCSEA